MVVHVSLMPLNNINKYVTFYVSNALINGKINIKD